jgi:endo-1,4-beta-D-glucanase Y
LKTKKRLLSLYIGVTVIVLGLVAGIVVYYINGSASKKTLVFSNNAMLYELWQTYKNDDLEASTGRTIDHSQPDNITTSEGESYTMIRAVWMDDQPTFNKSLTFSQNILQRPDHLFSWKFGELPNGEYGIETSEGGNNTASDGDTVIAMSLLMAYSRWGQTKYLTDAQQIITSIWNEEVVEVNGQPVMTADNLERNSKTEVVVDPSYFNPAAYRLFEKVDPSQNWNGLINNTYTILGEISKSNLGSSSSDGLPPDWIEMNRTTGLITPDTSSGYDTNYGYDAMRVPFWLALDYEWYHDPSDKQVLSQFSFLSNQWQSDGKLESIYTHNGSVVANYESPAMYGSAIGYFMLENPSEARSLYETKLVKLYNPNTQSWTSTLNYYNDNWAWFGLALYQNALPNLTTST